MTVAELIDKLRAMPQDLQVFIPDRWDDHPYMFVQQIVGVREVTADCREGGTFNWGWDRADNIRRGLSDEGICLMPEE